VACSLPLGVPEAMRAREKQERAELAMEALMKWLVNNAPELLEKFVKKSEALNELREME